MIYSYDIFDTIICRYVPKPVEIFKIMEHDQDVKALSLKNFCSYRQKSEFWLRRKLGRYITIEQIYAELCKESGIDTRTADILMACELRIEKEWSFLNNKIVDEIIAHIRRGEKVVLISDMYWHETQIREWLSEKNDIFNSIPIYISCDCKASKADGKIFHLVKAQENADFGEWLHTGDNKRSDGTIPNRMGIDTRIVSGTRKYDFESRIDGNNYSMLLTYRTIVEARRLSSGDAFDMGASIAGPLVYQYVEWVVMQAIRKGLSKLYFVLRDGYILKIVADEIIQSRKLPIETAYLFGSRVAWRFPAVTQDKLKNLSLWDKSNWIFRDPAFVYVPFERLGFSKDKLVALFGNEFAMTKLDSFASFKHHLDVALAKPEFVDELNRNIVKAGRLLEMYLEQTLPTDSDFALVDTNSTGKTQNDLNCFLQERHKSIQPLKFFYHTYLSDVPPQEETQFVFQNKTADDRRFPEAFFRAPYNPCYGYDMVENRVEPRFFKSEYCAWNFSFSYDEYLEGIKSFVNSVENMKESTSFHVDDYVDFLMRVVNFDIVSRDEIEQAAKLPFNPDLQGNEIFDFYPKLDFSAVVHPFSKLIYYPKGSFYRSGGLWVVLYKMLYFLVRIKRSVRS